MARIPDPVGSLDPQARALYDRLVAKRGRIDGMYGSLLNHPELTQHVSDLGAYLRFGGGVLPGSVRELAILWLARRLGVTYPTEYKPHRAKVPHQTAQRSTRG